jgi:medium-chain acyl-[acyl-carrier-protein] hydrolase
MINLAFKVKLSIMSIIKLFCFPYAGGSAAMFNKWKPFLNTNSGIELVPVELAGRGSRVSEPLYIGLQEAVDDLYQIVSASIGNTPYAFFGHSLGGLLVYELAQKIKLLKNIPQPLHLFFSGKSAPDIERSRSKKYHLMDNDDFKLKVIELGGTPPEFFNHPELVEFFLPMLKNDFRLSEINLSEQSADPFECNISVFLGKDDCETSEEQASNWKMHTKGICTLHYFNGGHFFLHDEGIAIIELINNTLAKHHYKHSNIQNILNF